jgi:hypothetical protein
MRQSSEMDPTEDDDAQYEFRFIEVQLISEPKTLDYINYVRFRLRHCSFEKNCYTLRKRQK